MHTYTSTHAQACTHAYRATRTGNSEFTPHPSRRKTPQCCFRRRERERERERERALLGTISIEKQIEILSAERLRSAVSEGGDEKKKLKF